MVKESDKLQEMGAAGATAIHDGWCALCAIVASRTDDSTAEGIAMVQTVVRTLIEQTPDTIAGMNIEAEAIRARFGVKH